MGVKERVLGTLNKMFNMNSWDYVTLAIVIFFISLSFLLFKHFSKKKKKIFQGVTLAAFFVYLAMVIYSVIISKDANSGNFALHLNPFYFLTQIRQGNSAVLRKTIMSVAFYYPFGFLYCLLDTKKVNYRKWPIIAFCAAFSFLIEAIQLIFKLALVETSDILLNTIGCCLGIIAYIVLDYLTFNEREL